MMLFKGLNGLFSQFVFAQCTDGNRIVSPQELSCMIGKIGRGAAQFLSLGEYVPQDLAEPYYKTLIHNLCGF